jgi:hypothetical protein
MNYIYQGSIIFSDKKKSRPYAKVGNIINVGSYKNEKQYYEIVKIYKQDIYLE